MPHAEPAETRRLGPTTLRPSSRLGGLAAFPFLVPPQPKAAKAKPPRRDGRKKDEAHPSRERHQNEVPKAPKHYLTAIGRNEMAGIILG